MSLVTQLEERLGQVTADEIAFSEYQNLINASIANTQFSEKELLQLHLLNIEFYRNFKSITGGE